MIKISVIIPTYKPQFYLEECLKSLNEQSLSKFNFEVLLILNGCSHPYVNYIKELIKKYCMLKIRFLYTSEPGVSNARNIGIDNATGEYITFIDDDDWVSATYLEELLVSAGSDVVSFANIIAYEDAENKFLPYYISSIFEKYKNKSDIKLISLRSYFNVSCCKLIHRSVISDRRYDKTFKNGEDTLYMTMISDKCKKFKSTSASAIYYRRLRSDSAVNRKRRLRDYILNDLRLSRYYLIFLFNRALKYDRQFICLRIIICHCQIVRHTMLRLMNRL